MRDFGFFRSISISLESHITNLQLGFDGNLRSMKQLKTRYSCLVFVLAAIFGFSSSAFAGEIKICFSEWSPYAYQGDGKVQGIAVDVANRVFGSIGYTINYQEDTPLNCRRALVRRQVEGILLSGQEIGPKLKAISSSLPIVTRYLVSMVRVSSSMAGSAKGNASSTIKWLKREGDIYPASIRENKKIVPVDVDASTSDQDMIAQLEQHQVDVIFGDFAELAGESSHRDMIKEFRILKPAIFKKDMYLLLANDYVTLMKAYNSGLTSMIKSGDVDRIYHRYLAFDLKNFKRYADERLSRTTSRFIQPFLH